MTTSLRPRLQADLAVAIKSRDPVRVSVLRTALAAIDNAEAVDPAYEHIRPAGLFADVARRELTEGEVRSVLEAEYTELLEAVRSARRLDQDAPADALAEQAAILAGYLDGQETRRPLAR